MSQTEVQLIKDAVIVNADVSNSAAIDVSKISGAMPLAGGTFTGDILFQSDSGNILFDKSDNALEFSDDVKAKFGGSSDLEIYHSGNFNFIVNNNSKNLAIQAKSGENAIVTVPDGEVILYHDNTARLQTSSTGLTLTGDVLPATTQAHDLGSTNKKWSLVHADYFHGNGSNLTNLPAAQLTGALPAIDGSALTGVSSAEIYGFNTDANGNLIVTTTNGGSDNISGTTFDAFEDVVFAATGISFSVNASGDLIATI